MASGVTNRGKYLLLGYAFRGTPPPTNYYAYLVTALPTVDTNTLSDMTEASNYAEVQLTPNATDFDTYTEDDVTNDNAYVQLKDIVFTASGGTLTCKAMVITDDNVTEGSRQILAWWDLNSGADVNVSDGQTLTVPDAQITLG